MNEKIYFRDLYCFRNATEEAKSHRLFCPNFCFDLTKLSNRKIAFQLSTFIEARGMKLSPFSVRSELFSFNLLCKFLNDVCPDLDSFEDIRKEEVVRNAKKWLLKNGRSLIQKRKKAETGKIAVTESMLVKYIGYIYQYLNPPYTKFCYESDRWYLDGLPIELRKNPTKNVVSISFKKIIQTEMREEVKRVIYLRLSFVALGTIAAEITAINRFSKYLNEFYPEVKSFADIDRKLIEKYLIYTNTEAVGRTSYSKDLCHLRSVFITAGKVLENKRLENIFLKDDIAKTPAQLYRVYSDEEIKRLNNAIVEGEEQIARLLFIHQLIGTRISETLTLKQDAVYEKPGGGFFIRIQQVKTKKTYEKAINEDVKKLFDRACFYTKSKYGVQEYVFVSDKAPDKPMQYSRLQYQLMVMIRKKDLRDDHGELFGVGTHIWRHCYGKRLTEMHVDDVTIAKLLGHANTSNLKHYRKIGNRMLAEETREVRDSMDAMLEEIIIDW